MRWRRPWPATTTIHRGRGRRVLVTHGPRARIGLALRATTIETFYRDGRRTQHEVNHRDRTAVGGGISPLDSVNQTTLAKSLLKSAP